MNLTDIIALANAGFTAQQIAGLATANQTQIQSTTSQTAPTVPTTIPAQPPTVIPTPQIPSAAVTAPQNAAPVATPAPTDPIMAQLQNLTTAIQANGILNSQMPITQPETPEDVLASIINPPALNK